MRALALLPALALGAGALAPGEVHVLAGHGGTVTRACWSPDGRLVATACADGVVRLFDAATGALARELRGHTGVVWDVAFTCDGTRVVSGGRDGTARIWAVADGACAHVLPHGRPGAVLQVHVVSDEQLVLHGGHDTPQVWRLADGTKAGDLAGHTDVVWAIAHAAGRWVATGSQDRTVRLWDVHRGGCVGVFGEAKDHPRDASNLGPGAPVLAVAVTADGGRVAGAHRDGGVRVWDTATGRELLAAQVAAPALAVRFVPGTDAVVVGDGGGAVTRLAVGGTREKLTSHGDWVQALDLSADGARVASGAWDGSVAVATAAASHPARVTSVAFSPDARRLLSTSGDRTARIWSFGG